MEVLADERVAATTSETIGPGARLAAAPLLDFDAAVAVLPPGGVGLSAVQVEVGIALGRGLPLLLIVPPDTLPPAGLSDIRYVKASLDNRAALKLHIGIFFRSLSASPTPGSDRVLRASPLSPQTATAFQQQLRAIREDPPQARGVGFEHLVLELLRAGGAMVEQDKRLEGPADVDAVAVIPGEEERLGPLLVEVKHYASSPRLRKAERQLQSRVLSRGGGLGLLIYDSPEWRAPEQTTPLVLTLRADDLVRELEQWPLADVLVRARNEAIHRM
jgi:hypothetical protein